MSLTNKVVIITGASSGIGEATAYELAKYGAKVVLAARREDRLIQIKQNIEKLGGTAIYQVTDVTKRTDMEKVAQTAIQQYGNIDALINNAGVMPLSFMNKLKVDEWDRMIDVNIKGVLYGIAAVLPHMEERKQGHIVSISSVAGHEVHVGGAVYSGTKYAVRAITEGLRKEQAHNNIRTTIISPGAVVTELTETITDIKIKELLRKRFEDTQSMEGEDIARAIRYCLEQPDHVSVNEIIVRPTQQK
ncbi:SDR family oxidoreductase [Ammoniphilus sp. CFH 90114]|uniref:SDR family oxidoreductase n=1 Tax=Ammoniphilus sp. CFH 90114 TaxID=2493665 RepID=UPI00100DBCAE|nr:SDR family oxidoreductase [Ammoniphilus sp. CFH 90114]RXT06473.1 SDR family oxidoreductase [Ammoniphilus sp. CFH 90114]